MPHLANEILLECGAKVLSVIPEGKQKVNQPLLVLCDDFLQRSKTEL